MPTEPTWTTTRPTAPATLPGPFPFHPLVMRVRNGIRNRIPTASGCRSRYLFPVCPQGAEWNHPATDLPPPGPWAFTPATVDPLAMPPAVLDGAGPGGWPD